MPHFDTSSIIYAWDNYPIGNLPRVWDWLGTEIGDHRIGFSSVVEDEVERNSKPCHDWLKLASPRWISPTQAILADALRIKTLLGIIEDRYGGGVNENDLIILATARASGEVLVTNERRQYPDPRTKRMNFKIPAVGSLPEVQVQTIDFLEYLRSSGRVLG